jgi:hypothetical protein
MTLGGSLVCGIGLVCGVECMVGASIPTLKGTVIILSPLFFSFFLSPLLQNTVVITFYITSVL